MGMKVLFVSAEVAPFSSVGGLSQVSRLLPKALLKRNIDIRIFTPKYGTIDEKYHPTKVLIEGLKVPTGEDPKSDHPQELICNVKTLVRPIKSDPVVYFLENMEYFEKRANVYNYSDDHIRFGLLSRAVLEFIKTNNFVPDLIHTNDWHTGYLVDYLRNKYNDNPLLKKIAVLFSVHNLYQSVFDFEHASEMDFDDGKSQLSGFFTERFFKQNAFKRGLIYSDIINTVSETYSREILNEEYSGRLSNLFREVRDKLFGIINGLNYQEFDPKTDKIIKTNFNLNTLDLRNEDKVDLQKEFNLKIDPDVPILAMSGRLDIQKGLDLVMETIDFVLTEFPIQFIVLGPGEDKYRDFFLELEKKYPHRVGTHLMKNFVLPRKIFAGADMILMPSRYEPGGIVALEAMRYGCIPIVRETGGLADSVINFNPKENTGTGFSFKTYSEMSFLTAIVRALETYKNKKVWRQLVRNVMRQDFSWDHSAKKYEGLYKRAIESRQEKLTLKPTDYTSKETF